MFLLDASAFYSLALKSKDKEEIILRSKVLDLTLYEIGNAVWKESIKGNINYSVAIEIFARLFSLIEIIRLDPFDLSEIEKIAVNYNISFYDASYVFYAKKLGLKLITKDKELLSKASEIAISVEEI